MGNPIHLGLTATLVVVLCARPASAQEDCDDWNTGRFFRNATAETVAECLEAGANLNARAEAGVLGRDGGATPLHLASRYCRDPGAVTVLLAAGADVHARDLKGATPLHVAAGVYRNPRVFTQLVEGGADLNARDDSGNTPLHVAWTNPNPVVAHRLLELGADPAARNDRGQVADPMSCEHWNTEAFARTAILKAWKACLESGADVNARDEDGNTPLLLATLDGAGGTVGAAASDGPGVLTLLLEAGAEVNARSAEGDTPLLNVVRRLPDLDVDPDVRSSWGTPLHRAGGLGDIPDLITALLGAGADVNVRSGIGRSLLHEAARYGDSATIAALVVGGAEVDAQDNFGETPLHGAIEAKKPANVTALLEAGADPLLRMPHGATPLHMAAVWPPMWNSSEVSQHADTAMVVALVAAGADVNGRNNWGETPLHVATRNGHAPVVAKLLALRADPVPHDDLGRAPRPMVCDWTNYDFFQNVPWESVLGCLQSGADVHARNENGETPLHRLASDVSPDRFPAARVIAALVEAGADVNARDLAGRTPLHGAMVSSGYYGTAVAAALLEAGADVKAGTNRGYTPLHGISSLGWRYREALSTVSLLAEAGADVDAADSMSRTPLHRALRRDDPRVVARLLELGSDTAMRDISGSMADPTGCERWNTGSFFHVAPIEIVAGCIEAGADVNARSEGRGGALSAGSTPLHLAAAWSRDPAVVRLLVQAGSDVNAWDKDGFSPLHRAAQLSDDPVMIVELLEAGAEIQAWAKGSGPYTNWHETPLHEAAGRNGNPAVTAALLEAGADVHARSEEGDRTPLHRAANANPNPAVVRLLLEAGADVNSQADFRIPHRGSHRGLTPLHAAARSNPAVFMILLAAGADPAALDEYGKTPMDYARENKALQELEVVKRSVR